MFDYLSYINVNTPTNFQNFIRMFSYNIFSILPNFFDIDDSEYQCELHPKLRDNELSCLTLNNMGSNLPVLFIIAVLYLTGKLVDFLMTIGKVDQKKILEVGGKKRVIYWIFRVKNFFGLSFYWAIFNGMQLDLLLGGWAIFKVDVRADSYTLISALLSVFILLNISIYLSMVHKAYYKFIYPKHKKLYPEEVSEKLEKNNANFLELFESINLESPKNILFLYF